MGEQLELAARNHPASFRDPSGFIFSTEDGQYYRQVNRCYEANYRQLMESGLHGDLVRRGLLIDHEEAPLALAQSEEAAYVLRPRQLPFISYAYEWSFSALRDAALLTLAIQRRAIESGMWLKDASHFNIQFEGTTPCLIDTLSFERYEPGQPWPAYGQFCRHFLAPLALMAKSDVALARLLVLFLDGVPLDLASKLLPWRTRLSPGMLIHLHLHAKLVRRYSDTSRAAKKATPRTLSKRGFLALLDSLENTIRGLKWKAAGTEWADYYNEHSYSSEAFGLKQRVVAGFLNQVQPGVVWDLGANTGVFSRLAIDAGARAYSFDIDPACVERCYLAARKQRERRLLPLLLDLSNPTPAIGWANRERPALFERARADLVMALALVHHLAISNNVPLPAVADMLAGLGKHLIIEFVPKADPQVQRLLQSRPDIFSQYDQEQFEAAFARRFQLLESAGVGDDGRVLYLMSARDPA